MAYSTELEEAMSLPEGTYRTPKLAQVGPRESQLVGMWGTAVTDAKSSVPVIGTGALNPCGALILYNRRSRKAILTHRPHLGSQEFEELLSAVRTSDSDRVEVHVVGLGFDDSKERHADENNQTQINYLNTLAASIKHAPNVTLKTFDVFTRPHPIAVAFDTRNGTLIRGSKRVVSLNEGDKVQDYFPYWPTTRMSEDFDGTVSELRAQRGRNR